MTTATRDEISIERSDKFEGWAIVEQMGHKKYAGFVTEQVVAGVAMLRLEVPETHQRKYISDIVGYSIEVKPGYTKLLGGSSLFCITPTNEATARACAQEIERYNDPIPVTLPRLLAAPAASSASAEIVDVEVLEESTTTTLRAICPQCGDPVEEAGLLCSDCADDEDDDDDFDDEDLG